MAEFAYSPMFPLAADNNEYELVTSDHVKLVEIDGEQFLRVAPEGLTELAEGRLWPGAVSYTHLTLPTT